MRFCALAVRFGRLPSAAMLAVLSVMGLASAPLVGQVAKYAFDEGSGITTADSSGNGLNGLLTSTTWTTAGKNGAAVSFNGSTSYVNLGNPTLLRLTGSMTVSAWVRATATPGDDGQIVAKSNNANGWQLKTSPDTGPQTFAVSITGSGSVRTQRYSTTVRQLDTWYHVAGVYNAAARTLDIYVNGVLDNGVLVGAVPGTQTNANVNVNVGRRSGGFYFAGTIDDVRIYTRALAAAEIQADMNTPAGAGPDTQAPTAPGNLTATTQSANQVNLSWTAATDNVGVAGYRLERCQGAGCFNFAQIATPAGTTYSDTQLTANTSYTYRVRAADAVPNLGPYSNSATAVTAAGDTQAPTVPTNLTAVAASNTQINLSWVASTDNTAVTNYLIERCSGAACTNFVQTGTSTGPSYADTGLTASTTFNYRVRATDSAANLSGYSSTANATTLAAASTLLAAFPFAEGAGGTTVSAAGGSITGTLNGASWTAAGRYGNALSFDGAANYVDLGNPVPLQLTGSMTVSAWVRATATPVDDGQIVAKSDNSAGWQFKTSPDTGPHTFAIAVSADSSSHVQRYSTTVRQLDTWYHVAGVYNAAARTLDIYVNGVLDNGVLLGTIPAAQFNSAVNVNIGRRTGGYHFAGTIDDVRIYNRALAAAEIQADLNTPVGAGPDTQAPTAPGTLTATAQSASQINLNWTAATDNVGVTGHRVERCQGVGCSNFAQIATPAGTTYTDTQVTANTSYTYRVRAADFSGNLSSYSNPSTAITPAPDTQPPTTPSGVTASAINVNQVNLSWSASSDNVAVTGYRVERCQGATCVNFTQLAAPTGTTYSDLTVAAGLTYRYQVRAADAAGNLSGYSTPVSAVTPASNNFQNEIIVSGLNLPTSIKFLPDGRMLILELGGKIRVLQPGASQPDTTPFLQITNIGTVNSQQGLMDLVLDPDFATNNYYYVFYTLGSPNRDRVSRFTAAGATTVSGSEFVVWQDSADANAEHHGGALNFGNDGKLYMTTGEHFDPSAAQSLASFRGKILRINKDGTVPPDNPFNDGAGPNREEIWAMGLRNPFRAYYDKPSGRFYVADVGGNDYTTAKEEVNLGVAGANYGWPGCEGSCSNPAYTSPLYSYSHNGRDASITGGFIYRGSQFPAEYYGNYFFADYTQNWIKRLTLDASGNVTGVFNFEPLDGSLDGPYGDIVYLTEGPDGSLYYVDLGFSDVTGTFGVSKIRRIRYTAANQAPVVSASAAPASGSAPLSVSFSSAGSVDPEGTPLTFLWSFGDGTSSTQANPVHVYSLRGQYTARLTVSDGVNSTNSAAMLIVVGAPPTATILVPTNLSLFRAGNTISFSGDANDPDDGNLPASSFTWNVDFLHEGHVHPGIAQTGTKSGSFDIPTSGHDFSGNTRYQIRLTVTDSDGLQDSKSVLVYPDKVNLTFDTVPSGLNLLLDGLNRTTPFVHDALIGFNHVLDAPAQSQGATAYSFLSWSDGGARQHTITVPAAPQSFQATFTATQNPIPAGLVAGYSFNEGSGSAASDRSGNGNTATVVNGAPWVAGKYGTGLSFDGTSHYLTIPNSPSLDILGAGLSLSMWVNPQPLPAGGDSVLLGKFWGVDMNSPFYQYGLELTGGNQPYFYLGTSSGMLIAPMNSTIPYGQWTHLVVVFDGTQVKFYANGNLVRTQSMTASITARGKAINIGADLRPLQFHRGLLDEVRIYNRALTAAEVLADMNAQ